jgi:hypothetical protein
VLSTEGGRAIASGGEIVFGVEVAVEAGEMEGARLMGLRLGT